VGTRRDCGLAKRTSIKALQTNGTLFLTATGDIPTPGWDVVIERSLLDVEPPAFNVIACRQPGSWIQVVTPYRASGIFEIGTRRDVVIVHHAEGVDEVTVENALSEDGEDTTLGFPASASEADSDVVTGYSPSLSFDEAFSDALRGLPHRDPQHPDALEQVTVEEIGALFGGLAGFNHLYVRVRRREASS
jgi:hypothetical protein